MDQQLLFYVTLIAAVAAVISATCDVRSVLRERAMEFQSSPRPRRYYTGAVVWALIACAAVGFDYWDRYYRVQNVLLMSDFGVLSENRVYAVVNTRSLTFVAKDHYIMLALRIDDNQTDLWLDKRIEKSSHFLITGGLVQIEMVPSTPFIRRAGKGQMLSYFLLLMPQNVEADQILSLSQVKELGGQVINHMGAMVTQQAFDQPVAPAAQ
jgi:hypothetical protein